MEKFMICMAVLAAAAGIAIVCIRRYYRKRMQAVTQMMLECLDRAIGGEMQEEIFGPLLPVFTYDDIKEPLEYINSHEKPLALYIFSENSAETDTILKNTLSGGVSINDTVSHIINPCLPFGGVGQSGMGNYHGEYGFLNFTHMRSVLKRSTRIQMKLAFPPYSDKKFDAVKKFMK